MRGGSGGDFLFGQGGSDRLFGGPAFDQMGGDAAITAVFAQAGSGKITLTATVISPNGGPGGARINYDVPASITVDLAAGAGGITGSSTVDRLVGITRVTAPIGAPELSHVIRGNDRDNQIFVEAGNHTISGACGDDEIHGRAGADTMRAA